MLKISIEVKVFLREEFSVNAINDLDADYTGNGKIKCFVLCFE